MSDEKSTPARVRWARLRFQIIGQLLATPPESGELAARIAELAATSWRHPSTDEAMRFSAKAIERWFYIARSAQDPIRALERKVPKHAGMHPSVPEAVGRRDSAPASRPSALELQADLRQLGRARWADHIASTLTRPVLIIDEAQEALTAVFNELRVLASKELDSRQLLCVVFAGDARLGERLRTPELLPLGSRVRRRLMLDYASRDELLACLDHLLESAGNPSLMTTELKATLADHAAGNYRVLMNLSDELLTLALDRELPRLDEKLCLEAFAQPAQKKAAGSPTRKR
jgi:hypothetical protein